MKSPLSSSSGVSFFLFWGHSKEVEPTIGIDSKSLSFGKEETIE